MYVTDHRKQHRKIISNISLASFCILFFHIKFAYRIMKNPLEVNKHMLFDFTQNKLFLFGDMHF